LFEILPDSTEIMVKKQGKEGQEEIGGGGKAPATQSIVLGKTMWKRKL